MNMSKNLEDTKTVCYQKESISIQTIEKLCEKIQPTGWLCQQDFYDIAIHIKDFNVPTCERHLIRGYWRVIRVQTE